MLNEECLGRGYRQGKGPTMRLTSGLRARHFSRALQMLVTSECNVVCAKVEDGSERDRDGMSLYRKRLNYSLNRDYIAEARSHQEAETTVITSLPCLLAEGGEFREHGDPSLSAKKKVTSQQTQISLLLRI